MTVIGKIEKLLAEKNIKQAALEREAMLAENRIAKLKDSDGRLLKAHEALRIARVLGVSLEWLVDDEMEEMPESVPKMSEAERTAALIVRQEGYNPETVYRLLRPKLDAPSEKPEIGWPPEPPPRPKSRSGRGPGAKGGRAG